MTFSIMSHAPGIYFLNDFLNIQKSSYRRIQVNSVEYIL
ncbi:hypothetical protein TCEL_02245 [Thermobrachium celere DSM 8682]|uniref:Uncharacterized protein n=1 Tax=Thermobrachium celere DSM 8682 TaxID=941824 RepID=R7RSK7_9CLOT|nr:hypothetical protein TCEL_02245 [Thermobrachium celere DSM 8682]